MDFDLENVDVLIFKRNISKILEKYLKYTETFYQKIEPSTGEIKIEQKLYNEVFSFVDENFFNLLLTKINYSKKFTPNGLDTYLERRDTLTDIRKQINDTEYNDEFVRLLKKDLTKIDDPEEKSMIKYDFKLITIQFDEFYNLLKQKKMFVGIQDFFILEFLINLTKKPASKEFPVISNNKEQYLKLLYDCFSQIKK